MPNTYEDSSCQETNSSYERFLPFFPLSRAWRSRQSVSCSDLISVCRCQPAWLHQTRIEALSPPGERLQRPVGGSRCGLERILCPRTVLFKGMVKPVRLAS